MSTSMLLGIFDWIGDFFKALFDLIPKIMYLLYASAACILDILQLFFRKLAGLDVYYVDGVAKTGDIVTNFIAEILGMDIGQGVSTKYTALSSVFWSFVLFGIVVCFASTIIAIIKSHYTYNEKSAKGPMQYVYTAAKAIINMLAVPVIVVLGLIVSEALLTALDSITSVTSSSIVSLYGSDAIDCLVSVDTVKAATGKSKEKTYIYYDIFGFGGSIMYGPNPSASWLVADAKELRSIGAMTQTFSGSMFKLAAYNGNRARTGEFDLNDENKSKFTGGKNNSSFNLFKNAKDNDQAALMIDEAFANNLHINQWVFLDYGFVNVFASPKYFTNFLTIGFTSFSKFNVGLVWYYYDLWQFNFIVGFGGVIVCLSIFLNVIMGLMTRLFMCLVLFLISPPLFGLAPLDEGKASKAWRENFMKQVLMTYGAVVGMNLMLMILPYFNEIDFFNIAIADYFARMLLLIVGLITIKAVISTVSGLVGGADANKTGSDISKEVAGTLGKATNMTLGAAKIGAKGWQMTTGKGLSFLGGLTGATDGARKLAEGAGKLKDKMADGVKNSWLGKAGGFLKAAYDDPENAGVAARKGVRAGVEGAVAKSANAKFQAAEKALYDGGADGSGIAGYNAAWGEIQAGGILSGWNAIKKLTDKGMSQSAAQQIVSSMEKAKKNGVTSASGAWTGFVHNDLTTMSGNNFTVSMSHSRLKRAASAAGGASWQLAKDHSHDKEWTSKHGLGSALKSGFDGTAGIANDIFGKEGFVGEFLDSSKISPKPKFDKDTAASTAATKKMIAAQNREKADNEYKAWLTANPTADAKKKKAEEKKIYEKWGL